jgi:hypothetical protein
VTIVECCIVAFWVALSQTCYGLHGTRFKLKAPWPLLSAVFGVIAFMLAFLFCRG